MSAIREMISDDSGRVSSMRVLTAMVVCTVLATWAYSVVRAGYWIPLDLDTVAGLAASLGSKALQSNFELRTTPPNEVAK